MDRKNVKVYYLIFLFVIYIYSLLMGSDIWGDILSPIIAFSSSAIIWNESKKIINYKLIWIQFFLVALSWGIADFAWLIEQEIFKINPESLPVFEYVYLLSNIFIAIAAALYFYYNVRKWNIIQLVLDSIIIGSFIFFTIWNLIPITDSYQFGLNSEFIRRFLYFTTDLFSISIIVIMYISSEVKVFDKSRALIVSGVVIYILSDLYYVYLTLIDGYDANTLIDGVYMLSIIIFTIATVEKVKKTDINMMTFTMEPTESYGSSIRLIWILLMPLLLYISGNVNNNVTIHMLMVMIIYAFFRRYLQISIRNSYLLKKEKNMNDVLEQIVKERTKELVDANGVLERLSKRDVLTGLYNRRYFIEYLDLLIESSSEKNFSILCLDLDRFKSINDSHGHEIGDKVLIEIATRFQNCCQNNSIISRAGGDEFTILIEGNISSEDLRVYCDQIVECCKNAIKIGPYTFHLGVSIGVATFPSDSNDRDTLMKFADIAMYQCKKNYIGERYTFFDDIINAEIERKHNIELLLQMIDFDKEFQLFYQPQFRISDNSLVGMEALIRWNNPKKGPISPKEFIPIAEETYAIVEIGDWVINEALNQIKSWNEKYNLNLVVGINMSPKQIITGNFDSKLIDRIKDIHIRPQWIDIEITETSAMSSNEYMEELLQKLATIGISISIDDFGTGYSSLSYIKRFDIDRLKIAKELVDNIASDYNTLLIVKAIIMMAKGVGVKAIAEGVEDLSQLKILKELECDEIQGYLFGCPVPADVFEEKYILKRISK